jgi:hypothetical protein
MRLAQTPGTLCNDPFAVWSKHALQPTFRFGRKRTFRGFGHTRLSKSRTSTPMSPGEITDTIAAVAPAEGKPQPPQRSWLRTELSVLTGISRTTLWTLRFQDDATESDALMALMDEYACNVPDEVAEGWMSQINKAGRNIYFAWSGGINRDDPHHYRVQPSSFPVGRERKRDRGRERDGQEHE